MQHVKAFAIMFGMLLFQFSESIAFPTWVRISVGQLTSSIVFWPISESLQFLFQPVDFLNLVQTFSKYSKCYVL